MRAIRRCQPTRARTTRPGFTLLEALIALTITGLAGVAALAAFGAEMRTASRARQVLPAVPLAEQRLAVLRMLKAAELRHLPDSLENGVFDPPFHEYSWTARVSELSGESELLDATVRVSWAHGSYELRTRVFRADRGGVP